MQRRLWTDGEKALMSRLYLELGEGSAAASEFTHQTGVPIGREQLYGVVKRSKEQIERPFGAPVSPPAPRGNEPVTTPSWQDYAPAMLRPESTGVGVASQTIRTFVATDFHVPYHDREAVQTAIAILRDYRPDRVVILGDFLETESLTRHAPSSTQVARLSEEYAAGNLLLDQMQEAAPSAQWFVFEGNHENRVSKWVKEQKELAGALDVAESLYLVAPKYHRANPILRGATWVPLRDQPFCLGDVAFMHGMSEANFHTLKTATDEGPRHGCTYSVHGHMHSFQSATSASGYHSHACGWLGNQDESVFQAYTRGRARPWQTGVMLIESGDYDLTTFTPVHITHGRALVGGKLYGGEG